MITGMRPAIASMATLATRRRSLSDCVHHSPAVPLSITPWTPAVT